MKYPNRFKGLKVYNVNRLYWSIWLGCGVNLLVLIVLAAGLVVFLSVSSDSEASPAAAVSVSPLASVTPTVTLSPVVEVLPTYTPFPTYTPLPTLTPVEVFTPFPTATMTPSPMPSSTFTPFPTPTRVLLSYEQLSSGLLPSEVVVSSYPYGFYRALCVSYGPNMIQPKLVGVDSITGVNFRIWNDYGWSAMKDWDDLMAFHLSDQPSDFHVQGFYYDEPITDLVTVNYPGSCMRVQVIYVAASPPIAENVQAEQSISITVVKEE